MPFSARGDGACSRNCLECIIPNLPSRFGGHVGVHKSHLQEVRGFQVQASAGVKPVKSRTRYKTCFAPWMPAGALAEAWQTGNSKKAERRRRLRPRVFVRRKRRNWILRRPTPLATAKERMRLTTWFLAVLSGAVAFVTFRAAAQCDNESAAVFACLNDAGALSDVANYTDFITGLVGMWVTECGAGALAKVGVCNANNPADGAPGCLLTDLYEDSCLAGTPCVTEIRAELTCLSGDDLPCSTRSEACLPKLHDCQFASCVYELAQPGSGCTSELASFVSCENAETGGQTPEECLNQKVEELVACAVQNTPSCTAASETGAMIFSNAPSSLECEA
ncbi:hypothetical protein FVE85_3677 [Porphyridium purpureum]|uniref:Uncharacterized protein n=1 Tax=Porphyridium purpureum TaxID=35688 RepID=A0A5J4YL91_PORPP|nr:hypothetical protein FVE85_3677 [Porphyridium purpureum]|eukprot:POR3574..scf249_10